MREVHNQGGNGVLNPRFDFDGKLASLPGGPSGIAHAIALAFRDAGAEVWTTGTREGVSAYESDLVGMVFRRLDLEDPAAIEALPQELPKLDVLVNAAGTTVRNEAGYEPANFERVIAVNLNGAFRLAMACRPALQDSRGSIINIASMTSYFGAPGAPGYGASKAGILELTQSLAVAWAADGIRVNGIAPGWIETKLTSYWREEGRDRQILERTPMGRWGRPGEMAGAALFLASEAASFITGITLPVDGGYTAK
jgi:NAD(P)-dependent dehydrogenase (short-subunit alcohol dehydrogenase family)